MSLGVGEGERIGVVGRNGSGKSTLIRILGQRDEPDTGRVTRGADVRVGYLRQGDELPDTATVRQVVVGDRPEHQWAGEAHVRDVLTGLLGGYDEQVMARSLGAMSGGERRRVDLARLLVSELDVLLLDEPTNHLDLEVVAWLAAHLNSRPRLAVVVVTHDRWFLDEVCGRMWEVVAGGVEEYEGGYSAYVLAKAERDRQAAIADQRRSMLVRKELAWLRRGPPARTSKPKFRIDAANELIGAEPPPRNAAELLSFASSRLGRTVYELHDATIAVGEHVVADRVSLNIGPGQRLGVLGANGSGKTTLLRTLVGELKPPAGRLVTGVTVRPAYLSQSLEELDPGWRVLESVERVSARVDLGKGRELSAAQLCERLGFGSGAQWTPVGDLSGGERRRLQLTRLLMGGPNVLLLDEPTNDLDVETLSALEDLLDGFAGTIVVVSHDRYFLERVCDDFVCVLPRSSGRPADLGAIRGLPGGVDQYLTLLADARGADAAAVAAPRAGVADSRTLRKELARLERQIDKLEQRERGLHLELAAHATDHAKVLELSEELHAVVTAREAAEAEWLELAD